MELSDFIKEARDNWPNGTYAEGLDLAGKISLHVWALSYGEKLLAMVEAATKQVGAAPRNEYFENDGWYDGLEHVVEAMGEALMPLIPADKRDMVCGVVYRVEGRKPVTSESVCRGECTTCPLKGAYSSAAPILDITI